MCQVWIVVVSLLQWTVQLMSGENLAVQCYLVDIRHPRWRNIHSTCYTTLGYQPIRIHDVVFWIICDIKWFLCAIFFKLFHHVFEVTAGFSWVLTWRFFCFWMWCFTNFLKVFQLLDPCLNALSRALINFCIRGVIHAGLSFLTFTSFSGHNLSTISLIVLCNWSVFLEALSAWNTLSQVCLV